MPRRASKARNQGVAKGTRGRHRGTRSRIVAPDSKGGQQLEDTLLFVAERSWAISAEEFFPSLVRHLGESLGMDYAIVSALADDGETVETVAVYAMGQIAPNMRYALRDTPCGNVIGRKLCLYPEGIRELFPHDTLLADMRVESYIGMPLWDSKGQPIGLIAVLDGEPISQADSIAAALQLVATRAATELERKRAEDALRKSESRYRGLFEHSPVSIWEEDLSGIQEHLALLRGRGVTDWAAHFAGHPEDVAECARRVRIIDVNHTGLKFFGVRDRTDLDAKLPGYFLGGGRAVFQDALVAIAGGKTRFSGEFPFRGPDGEGHVASLYLDAVPGHEQSLARVLVSFVDITGRKRAEEEQRLSAQRVALHVEQTPLAVVEWDLDFKVRGWNPAAERIFGFSREEAIGRHASFIVPESAREQVNEVWRALLAQGGGTRSTNENITKKCRTIICDWFNTPLVDSDGRTVGVASLVADVTERHRAEEQRARLGMAVEQAVESIVITDTDGTILYVNPAFEAVSGYSQTEAVGKNASILKSGKHDEAYYRAMWRTLSGGGVWRGNFINRRKDGQLFEEAAIISPVRDAAGKVVNYVAVKRDVTRERQVEEQLRQSQKMNAIGQLAGGVAHDFNNLLNVILGYSDLLLEEGEVPAESRGQIEEIRKAGERAAALTRQLLAFSRKQILDPRVFDLGALVADMSKMLRRLIGEHIELNLVSSSSVCSIRADPGQIEQVVMNLCVNARDAMPGGGKLTIETRRVRAPWVSPGAGEASGECIVLSIGDTGAGMSPEVKSHLFEPFFTTKKEGTGVGLGLATSYGIVRQSGGEIAVRSEVGQGTTFEIRFPFVPEPVTRDDASQALATMERGRGETVLLVEDDVAVRDLVEHLLRGLGYRVLAAAGGEAALALAEPEGGRRIDLLLTDVVMPGMNGRQVATQIKSRFPEAKVIFTSGYAEDTITHNGELDPSIVFLPKPFALTALARRIREVLENSGPKP